MVWAALAAAAIPAIGSVMGANAQAKGMEEQAKMALQGTRETNAEQGRQFDITNTFQKQLQEQRQKAYNEAIMRGGGQMGAAETSLFNSLNTENPELATQEQDIRTGNAKAIQDATGQINANLAMQGVRGGQAATLANRQIGEMGQGAQKDINQMKFQDSSDRAALLRAYQAAKAGRGQTATLPGMGVSI